MTLLWANFTGSVTCAPQALPTPHDEAALIALVKQANATHQPIRVVGSGHSFVPLCATDGLLVSLDGLQGMVAVDRIALTVTVWAGTKLHQLGEPFLQAGVAMMQQPDIERQSLAGAISTGTHGTGPTLGNLSSLVVGLRLITADGDVIECSPTHETELFKAARVSLGLLGVITQITLRVLPAYKLEEHTWLAPFAECWANMASLIADHRHFEFVWYPRDDACVMKTLHPTTAETPSASPPTINAPTHLLNKIRPARLDWSWQIFPNRNSIPLNEIEFSLPAAAGPACLQEIRQLMMTKHLDVIPPVQYRTLAADDIWLSTAYERATIAISVHQYHDRPHEALFADVEAIFRNHHGRPHWGKMHTHTARELRALYPRWDDFQALRARMDPRGRFMNAYVREMMSE